MASRSTYSDSFLYGTFPKGFSWGTATASYQIEGAWNKDGKGPNIWDTFTHQEGHILNNDTGDIACDSYHKYAEDINLMKNMGVNHYRFSISWSRVMADGTLKTRNQKGIDYYNKLIDGLVEAGIKPMVTLYHWDLPQGLQDLGGWLNPDLAQYFKDYAGLCFKEFGDRVKMWITFNEPLVSCWYGFGNGTHAPGVKDPLDSPFKAAHTILRAHALAYHVYSKDFKSSQKGECGITNVAHWMEPENPNDAEDIVAAEKCMQGMFGWFTHPIFSPEGDYPKVLRLQLEKKYKLLGLKGSALPEFTEEEKAMLKGSADFFGLNHYTTLMTSKCPEVKTQPKSPWDIQDAKARVDETWERSEGSAWLYHVPWGVRKLLNWVKERYNSPVIYITENGCASKGDSLQDAQRINYYRSYLNEVLKAIKLDGVDVRSYSAWSLLDNFEWSQGYDSRFGLLFVDFTDPDRPRTPRASARFYSQVIKNNGFPEQSSI